MLRRHAFPLVMLASTAALAGCSPSGSQANDIAATDAIANDVVLNDETAADLSANGDDLSTNDLPPANGIGADNAAL